MKAPQTRITCWVDTSLLEEFHACFPSHGAITTVVRNAIKNAVKRTTKETKELLDG